MAAHSAAPDAPRDGVGSASGSAEVDVDADADLDAARRLLRAYRVRVCEVSDSQLQHELSAAGGLQATPKAKKGFWAAVSTALVQNSTGGLIAALKTSGVPNARSQCV